MARTKTVHGKRVGWSVKLSEPVSDAADAMRGSTPRAVWLAGLIDAALEGSPVQAALHAVADGRIRNEPPPRKPVVRQESVYAGEPAPDPVAALRAQMGDLGVPLVMASEMPSAPEPKRAACRHPSAAVIDGLCRECGEEVW